MPSLEVFYTFTKKAIPILIANTSLSIITPSILLPTAPGPLHISLGASSGREEGSSSEWLPSFADFFVLHQKAFLHLSWLFKRNPSCQFQFHSIYWQTQLNELFKWGCYEKKQIWICISYSFNHLLVGVTHILTFPLYPPESSRESSRKSSSALFARPDGDYCLLCWTDLH